MEQRNGNRIVRHVAAVAAIAALVGACSGSSDGADTETTTPATDPAESSVTAAPVATELPVATDAPVEDTTVEETEIPELPCADYVSESGYPLKPCDSGVLVETLQRDLESLFPGIAIDGLFGSQTYGFVQEFQTSNGLEATGLVSEDLAAQIASAESLGDGDASTDEVVTTDAAAADELTEEVCTDLIGNADDPNFTPESIEGCSALGIDIVGEA